MIVLDNRYELQGVIKQHSFGKLWFAGEIELKRSLLIREISDESLKVSSRLRQFLSQSLNLAQINHPNLQEILSHRVSADGRVYIFYNHPQTITLRSLIDHNDQLSLQPELALYITGQVAEALAIVHQAKERQQGKLLKIFHLGLTPDTILLTQQGGVLVTDFAIGAVETEKSIEESAYLAPEQISSTQTDYRTDIFALGIILYELATGKKLFPQNNLSELMAAILKGNYDISAIRDGEIIAVLENALQLNRAKRFSSAIEIADRITGSIKDKLRAPQKKIREYVEKFSKKPKLEVQASGERQIVQTEILTHSGIQARYGDMDNHSKNQRDGERDSRRSDKTVIRSIPTKERLKRVGRSGLGGNKTILFLSLIAIALTIGIGILVVRKILNSRSIVSPSDMVNGTITTIPEQAAIFRGDDSLGVTPGSFSAKEGEELIIRHPCCPDSVIEVDFDQFESEPIILQTLLEVTSRPSGAEITLNNASTGYSTPNTFIFAATDTVEFALTTTGKKEIRSGRFCILELDDYAPPKFDITNHASGGYLLSGFFDKKKKKRPPLVLINSFPSGATVYFAESGKKIDETPLSYPFGDNPVSLIIKMKGFDNREMVLPRVEIRLDTYNADLSRRVSVWAYEEGDPRKTVKCRITDVVYRGESHLKDVTYGNVTEVWTPAKLRLPGVETELTLVADGYYDTDTIITAFQKDITVVMRKKSGQVATGDQPASGVKDTQAAASTGIPVDRGEVKVFVVDKKNVPVAGVRVIAKSKKTKEELELKQTDADGRTIARLDPGKYEFSALHVDYKKGKKSGTVVIGKSKILTISIKRR